ncbi:hypothetical protein FIV42_06665 [Persicimonas caeni]|uniref:Uncharacterized protein n=1 Tax=Persicimonas caeni TaxID=2292766 RepID=A0A4Y6PRK8_PERCE|nr:hypothetical protein [Persicimonas caeni]QDG50425.1 hypothetical protein FIV42_06665 [Persicimonas caeni]QED31646.1 hypothetical protein FRD00_06660 [Persicimonas caeni]
MIRLSLKLLLLACWTVVGLLACDPPQPPDEDLGEVSENIEEAREETGDRPEGIPGENPDQPIEGSPSDVVSEIDRELLAYENRVVGADKKVDPDTIAKMKSARTRLDIFKDDLAKVDADTAEELPSGLEKRLAGIKKEWNQTKRQVDMQLDEKLEPENGD